MNLFSKYLFTSIPKRLFPLPTKHVLSGTPSYTFATFKDKLVKRQKESGEAEFRKEMEFMMNKPTFTLMDYKQRVMDTLDRLRKGIRAKLQSGNEQTEAQLTLHKKILNAMMDDELLDESKIKWQQKMDVGVISQTKVQDINIMMKKFNYMKQMHSWLRELKERGETAPNSQEELAYRFKKDRPLKKSVIKFSMKRPHLNRKQLRQRLKWGPRKHA